VSVFLPSYPAFVFRSRLSPTNLRQVVTIGNAVPDIPYFKIFSTLKFFRWFYVTCVRFWTSLCPPFVSYKLVVRARRGAVGWGTALQAGSSRVRFTVGSLGFFTDFIHSAALGPSGSTPEGGKSGRRIGLTTSYAECLEILEVSISWKPTPLSRPVTLPALQVHDFHFVASLKSLNISK